MPNDRPYTDSELFNAINGGSKAYPIKPWVASPYNASNSNAAEAAKAEQAKKAAEDEEKRKKAEAVRAQAEKEAEQAKGPANLFQGLQNFLKTNLGGLGQIANFIKTWEQQSAETFKDRNIIDGKPHTGGFGSALGKLLGVFSKIFEFVLGFFQSMVGNPAGNSSVAGNSAVSGNTSNSASSANPATGSANILNGLANGLSSQSTAVNVPNQPNLPKGPGPAPTGGLVPTGGLAPVINPVSLVSSIPTVGSIPTVSPISTLGSMPAFNTIPAVNPFLANPGLFFSNAGKTASHGALAALGELAKAANTFAANAIVHQPKISIPGLDQNHGSKPSKSGRRPVRV